MLFIFYALRDRGRRRMTTKEEKAKMEAAKWAAHMAKKKAKEAQRLLVDSGFAHGEHCRTRNTLRSFPCAVNNHEGGEGVGKGGRRRRRRQRRRRTGGGRTGPMGKRKAFWSNGKAEGLQSQERG